MITGVVKSNEARIRLKVKGPRGRQQEVEAVVDTGNNASLSLPPSLIAVLGLQWHTFERGVLADGSEILVDVYEAKIVWDGKERNIAVDESDSDPLIGMKLLKGYELKMQVRSRGKVTIKRLPRK